MIPRPRADTLLLCGLALLVGMGWFKRPPPAAPKTDEEPATDPVTQQMDGFTMAGYAADGAKRWELEGIGADINGPMITISRPDGVGYDLPAPPARLAHSPGRAASATGGPGAESGAGAQAGPMRRAHLTASVAQMEQESRRVRMEHDVTIHTSDGLWLSSPLLYWLPDRNELTTEQSVRLETDHMLLRAQGATGHTTLKQAVFLRDIELVLNPTSEEPVLTAPGVPGEGSSGQSRHVVITCDGPLAFDYTRYIATFEQNVHVKDGDSDLYSDTLVAYLDQQTRTIRYAEALGHVRITQGPHTAQGQRAVYEPRDSRMTLLGSPSLTVYPEAPARPELEPGRGVGETGVFGVSQPPPGPPAIVKGLHD